MARRPSRQRCSTSGFGWSGLGGFLLLLLDHSGGALAWFYFSAAPRPVLDAQSLCPVTVRKG